MAKPSTAMAKHGCNGGVFFHTGPQSKFLKKGYEAQVCDSCGSKGRTGSLFVVEDHDTSPVKDDEWFEYHILVSGNQPRLMPVIWASPVPGRALARDAVSSSRYAGT